MKIPAGKNFLIEIDTVDGGGYPRVVRLYKKRFLHRRLISSDWFLDDQQARRFADDLAASLQNDSGLAAVRSRPPGWRLKQSVRYPHAE